MTTVILTNAEYFETCMAGLMRHAENVMRNRPPTHGLPADRDTFDLHIRGALAERALAKHLGAYWHGKGTFGGADVGCRHEVRSVPQPNRSLILHPTDKDDHAYWLMHGAHKGWEVIGWIWGKDGKRQEWWEDRCRNGRPCFWVPQDALNHPDRRPDT
jgi:hypothetical protein